VGIDLKKLDGTVMSFKLKVLAEPCHNTGQIFHYCQRQLCNASFTLRTSTHIVQHVRSNQAEFD